jgi:hypothetical protein
MWKLTSRAAAGPGSFALGITITDAAGATRLTTTVHVARTASWEDIQRSVQTQIDIAMIADAGSKLAVLDGMIAAGTLLTG